MRARAVGVFAREIGQGRGEFPLCIRTIQYAGGTATRVKGITTISINHLCQSPISSAASLQANKDHDLITTIQSCIIIRNRLIARLYHVIRPTGQSKERPQSTQHDAVPVFYSYRNVPPRGQYNMTRNNTCRFRQIGFLTTGLSPAIQPHMVLCAQYLKVGYASGKLLPAYHLRCQALSVPFRVLRKFEITILEWRCHLKHELIDIRTTPTPAAFSGTNRREEGATRVQM